MSLTWCLSNSQVPLQLKFTAGVSNATLLCILCVCPLSPNRDVHCSLEIIKSLVLSSKAHLNIFSKNVVVILDTLLADISDYDIVRHCQNIFKCFCAAHDGSTLGVDLDFRTIYDRVVARFANIAILRGDNSNR